MPKLVNYLKVTIFINFILVLFVNYLLSTSINFSFILSITVNQ